MQNRPDWSEWILQKNNEAKQEELRKSNSVTLEKGKGFWSAAMIGCQSPQESRRRAMRSKGQNPDAYVIPKDHVPKENESKEDHLKRVGETIRSKFPNTTQSKIDEAANRAWDSFHGEDQAA